MRVDNMEFRMLENGSPEIIIWDMSPTIGEYCYTILFYNKGKEGYYIEFVGDRPLQVEDKNLLWKMMKYGQTVLNAQFDLLED